MKKEAAQELINLLPYHIECGKHSGFPPCCVLFFITEWLRVICPDDDLHKAYTKKKRVLERKLGFNIQYVPCPSCIEAGTVIEVVLPCSCNIFSYLDSL